MKIPIYLLEGKQYKPLVNINVERNSTIEYIKDTIKTHFENKYQVLDFFINSEESLNVFHNEKYNKHDFSSVWKKLKDPFIILISKTNFMDLPADMKKYLIERVEPLQALELCKTVKCGWKKLLDINYDFVTQGFAIGKNDEEKFRYLAERVSKNIDNEPEIVFVHFNGKPLGKTSFLKFVSRILEEEVLEEVLEEMIPDYEKKMKAIIKTLEESSSVDWLKQDDANMWIKVKDKENLPDRIVVKKEVGGHAAILRHNDLYDYPENRKNYNIGPQELLENYNYPGTVNINDDVIKNILFKLTEDEGLFEKSIEDQKYEIEYNAMLMLEDDQTFFDQNKEYNVYSIMKNGYTRSEAEVFVQAANLMTFEGGFLNGLKKIYNFTI
jgi:DNA polymerase III delta prime subunit